MEANDMDVNLRVPAEWNRHWAIQMHWPDESEAWQAGELAQVEQLYCSIIEELHFYEPIHLFVRNLEIRNGVMQKLSGKAVDLDRVIIHQQPIQSMWAREAGPDFIYTKTGYSLLKPKYEHQLSGSGQKEFSISNYVSGTYNLPTNEINISLNAAHFDSNGEGVLLATESMISATGKRSKEEVEAAFLKELGIKQIIWLKDGGTENSGSKFKYIDNIARWVGKETVLLMKNEDAAESGYQFLKENLERLRSVELPNGGKLKIELLPVAEVSLHDSESQTITKTYASYTNFYIGNGVVLVPMLNDRHDKQAKELIAKSFPGRKVIGIDASVLAGKRGSLHQITKQWYGKKRPVLPS